MKIALVLNADAGTLRGLDAAKAADELTAIFRERGHAVAVQLEKGADTIRALEKTARAKSADALVVGGGDGTVSAAAALAAKNDIALGILPLGTMNFFARSLAIPEDMKKAAAALADGEIRAVDIATVNGHMFVHTMSLGLHPEIVTEREKLTYRSRYGKMFGNVRAFVRVVGNAKRFAVAVTTDGGTLTARASGVVVSNNPFGEGHPPWADDVDGGLLGVYLGSARRWPEILRIAVAAARGRVPDDPLVTFTTTTAAEIHLRGPRHVKATLDGEIVRLKGPLRTEVIAGGLKVLAPVAAG